MKKFRGFCLFLTVVSLLLTLGVPAAAAEEGSGVSLAVSAGCATLDAQMPLAGTAQLLDTAKAVILYELDSGTLVYSWHPDQKIDPSGMNKIMTALLALEQGDPSAVVTVTKTALNSVAIGSVSAGLKAEEEITLLDLLYCMMVGSANDAAAVIAEYISGNQANFVGLMNQRAQELGCENTRFMNPTGLSNDDQYTTARDLAKITAAALENETFVELFSAVDHTVPATNKSEERKIVTTNYMMSQETVRTQYDERVTGGKTGALTTTDRSLICTAESGGKRFLSVVMSAEGTVTANGLSVKTFGSFEETGALLDHGFENYTLRQLLYTGQVMDQFAVTGGENDVIGTPAVDLTVTMPNDAEAVTYQCTTQDITAPIRKGQTIGTVEVWYGSVCVGQCDLIAMYDVHEPGVHNISLTPSAEQEAKRSWTNVLLIGGIVLLGLVALAGIALLILRGRNRVGKGKRKARQRS